MNEEAVKGVPDGDRPRSMRALEIRQRRKAMLHLSHVAQLTANAGELRRSGNRSPCSGPRSWPIAKPFLRQLVMLASAPLTCFLVLWPFLFNSSPGKYGSTFRLVTRK